MFNLLKRKKSVATDEPSEQSAEKTSFFSRLKAGLSKTRASFSTSIANLILGKKTLDKEVLELIETQLLTADVGIEATQQLIDHLTQKLARNELQDTETALAVLQEDLKTILRPCEQPLRVNEEKKPFVILVVGINGSGKTTTIGKLAKHLQADDKKVLLAAGDTFRA